jgi:hypothetical protein
LSGAHPLPEWAQAIARADVAYFVDASVDSAGTRLQIGHVVPEPMSVRSTSHALDGTTLLRRALDQYGRSPPTSLLLLPAESFAVGEHLSPRTAVDVQAAVDWLDWQPSVQLEVPPCTK